jgi:hypothetical protein
MPYCSNCGTQLTDGAKFCPKCGNAVGVGDNKFSRPNKRVNKRPKKEDISLTIAQKIALGISAIFAFIGLCGGVISASEGVWSILLVSICASAAIICVAIGEIDKKYAWVVAISSFIAIFVAIGSSAPSTNKESIPTKEEHFKELLPSNGSESFIIEGGKPIGDDGLIVKSIEFFEKNDTRDFLMNGILNNGKTVILEGKWDANEKEATYLGQEYKYYTFWCSGFDNYNFYVDSHNNLYCSLVFWDNDKDVGKAFQAGAIGKIKRANKQDLVKTANATQKESERQLAKYVGDYYYSVFIGDTNAKLYFKITLKSDGTFIHAPSNSTTQDYINTEIVLDGKSYPSGGSWNVSDGVISLDFNGNWSNGKISTESNMLVIHNMNGYDIKTSVSR